MAVRRIMIVAGEASGDLHGAALAEAIKRKAPEVEIFGIAGEKMRAAGVRAICRAEDIAALGLVELSETVGRTLKIFFRLRNILRRDPPALLIAIDFAEFNMALAGVARRAGVPVLYYIAPQVWAWRRYRARKLARRSDRLAVVFRFEEEFFNRYGARAVFVGHPILDRISHCSQASERARLKLGLAPGERSLALLPGSRRGEVRYLLPEMLEAARLLRLRHGLTPLLARAPMLEPAVIREIGGANLEGVRIIGDETYSILAASEVALIASGTATLEAALLQCPMVVAYRTAWLTYQLGRLLVRGVNAIAMPNILAGRIIVPELLQEQVTGPALAQKAEMMLDAVERARVKSALAEVSAQLGAPGASDRVADLALAMLK